MHYITKTEISLHTTPKQSLNQQSINPTTTALIHTTTTLNRHQASTKPTPNQHYITQTKVNPKENLKQPNLNCETIKTSTRPNRPYRKPKTNQK